MAYTKSLRLGGSMSVCTLLLAVVCLALAEDPDTGFQDQRVGQLLEKYEVDKIDQLIKQCEELADKMGEAYETLLQARQIAEGKAQGGGAASDKRQFPSGHSIILSKRAGAANSYLLDNSAVEEINELIKQCGQLADKLEETYYKLLEARQIAEKGELGRLGGPESSEAEDKRQFPSGHGHANMFLAKRPHILGKRAADVQ